MQVAELRESESEKKEKNEIFERKRKIKHRR